MKKVMTLSAVCLFFSGFLWFFLNANNTETALLNIEPATSNNNSAEKSKEKEIIPVVEPVHFINKTTTLKNSDIEKNKILIDSDVPFSGISRFSQEAKAILEEAGVLPKDLSGEAYVEFDLESLRELEAGDTFNLAIPQTSETFSAEVTKAEKLLNGDKSIYGRLVGSDGVLHTTVLTVGDDAVYGQFTTVSGNYVFESKGKHGWIAAKRDLYRSHIEFEPPVAGKKAVAEPIQVITPKK